MLVPDVRDFVDGMGGFATREELLAAGCWPERIDMAVYYGRILRVRRGRYASVDMPAAVLGALRLGGKLACVSALAHYEGTAQSEPIHVLVKHGSSRHGQQPAVVHWTRRELEGTRTLVSEEVARWQAASCRAARTT